MEQQKPAESGVTKYCKSHATGRTTGCSQEIPDASEVQFHKEKKAPARLWKYEELK